MNFRISLESYRGPLELLLYLVRKHELDVLEIAISQVTDQFLEYLQLLQDLNVDDVADFLDVASTLLEIKSRMALPSGGEEEETVDDPREELVQRLLEYKRYKDAASLLEEQSRQWQQHYPRLANDVPARELDLGSQPIAQAELWDLVSAFGRIIREKQVPRQEKIANDEVPIHVHMHKIHAHLVSEGRAAFSEMFETPMHKITMIGVFLALLELVRHHSVRAEQPQSSGEIWILPGDKFDPSASFRQTDEYEHRKIPSDELAYNPR
jgi:segregation and condensation protein A